jgi:hypothetical protein
VEFDSLAAGLVPGLVPGHIRVYVHDTLTGRNTLVSIGGPGQVPDMSPNGFASYATSLSSDGLHATYAAFADGLPGTTGTTLQAYERNLAPPY